MNSSFRKADLVRFFCAGCIPGLKETANLRTNGKALHSPAAVITSRAGKEAGIPAFPSRRFPSDRLRGISS